MYSLLAIPCESSAATHKWVCCARLRGVRTYAMDRLSNIGVGYQVLQKVRGNKHLVPKYLLPNTCYQALATKYLLPSTWYQVPST